tara:strand:+ start:531 stop:1244 length:714 start_codon:yes stop_codon:yes gene_type:complete
MIQAIRETNFKAYIETEASRIDTSVSSAKIRHLAKFTNDLDGAVFYAYATTEVIKNRYTSLAFTYGVADVYTGNLKLIPAGYFNYELYEVSWIGDLSVSLGNAPVTETDVLLPVVDTSGVVQGLVAIGKLYLSEKDGSEEVQYIENAKRVQKLTIQDGGTAYATAPTITIEAPGTNGGQTATATCTILAGVVDTVTITYAGSGYITTPEVTLAGGGFTNAANITASIEQTNYIYYGQ